MRFKTLEIQGFKSFPDKTVLSFDSKMTAIVGSNGNGKSNISDALRWVMGEQGAKTLRGDKMEDVIFHGTEKRKPMGFAKVALSVDNSDRKLPIDDDEVVVARKLYRSGDSEYLINGEKSRLKDVHELFMGTGLGRDGYSIIGQGRVAEVVNAKTTQRREIFEEAAGVSKFLHQKEQAERELSRAEENLLRLLDIEAELQSRLAVLEKQAEKAKKARALSEEEKRLGVSLSVRELENIGSSLSEAENAVLLNQGECEHFEREINELEEEGEEVSEEKLKLFSEIERLRKQSDSAKDEIAGADKDVAVAENEITHNKGRISAIKEQIENSEKSGREIEKKAGELKKRIGVIENEIIKLDKKIENENSALAGMDRENSELDVQYRDIDREIGELYAAGAAAKIHISRAGESVADLNSQLDEAREIVSGQSGELEKLKSREAALTAELGGLTAEKEETANKLSGYGRLYETKASKLDAARDEFDRVKQDYQQKESRFAALSDVERNMVGYQSSVKAVIVAAKAGKLSDIHGTVADIIRVEKKFSAAAEIALGPALQNIIVGTEAVAKRCIRFLKESNGGRATFLPLTSVKGRALEQAGLDGEEGFLGLGHEIVLYDGKYDGIIKSLLGRTAFAEDIDAAVLIAKKHGYKFKIVTLDGQVINAGGSFTGGSIKESAGIISRKREIETLGAELKRLSGELDGVKSRHSVLAAETAKMKLECEGMREVLAKISGEEMRLTAEIGGVHDMIRQFEEQRGNSEITLNRCETRLAEEKAVIEKNNAELKRVAAELEKKEALAAEKSRLLERSANRRKEISASITGFNIEKLAKTKDIEGLNAQIAALDANREETKAGAGKLLDEIGLLNEKNLSLLSAIEEKRSLIAEINRKFGENKEETALLIKKSEDLEKRAGEINSGIREKTGHKEKFSNALAAALERKAAYERTAEEIRASLWDVYSLAPSEAAAYAAQSDPFESVKAARSQLAEIRRKLAALGEVNYAAITEFTETKERYGHLSEQLADVRGGKRELEKLIADLTVDIRARFLESFNEINRHFGKIFADIFGGGSARLELTEPDDALGSGIEIYAAPPGKLIKNLIALSGGEQAMVAITIYFAILLHRPTPFCMLDEVDAALDEVNVAKYVNYLKRYSDSTQLMLITHRRSTIEGCDVLYGVFMQEKGVSRMIRKELGGEEEWS
ncbi:MAG: chromosome segregation protein SMC [Oscillospiraceae bacterium]|jgi:chromosome segregation protein|nr:chromosome segregation protein SMC [Oscillospiraceae bacterium]